MKILVRNVARDITETQLCSMFEIYGKIQSCSIVLDKETGKSKGFGFVEMPKSGEARAAIKNLNGKEVNGSKLRIKKSAVKLPDKDNKSTN